MVTTILRLPSVTAHTGLSRSTLYLRISKGVFPPPVNLGERSVGWPENEINAINAARIAGMPDEELRALTAQLVANRTKAT